MARIALVSPEDEPADLRPTFDQLRTTRGRVPGMYRTLAHHPAILHAHRAYFHAALDTGLLDRKFKEKIAFRVATLRGSDYSSASHRSYALRHGVSEAEIEIIRNGDYSTLAAPDRIALAFADELVIGRGVVRDETFDELASRFTPAEIVEIVALIGIMQLASDFGMVFELAPD
jgi:AhpD family alkylhydroperoxidase